MKEFTLVEGAKTPEDIFGKLQDAAVGIDSLGFILAIYRRLRIKLHPDHNSHQPERAHKAFEKLTEFYSSAENLIKNGTYGKPRSIMTISTKTATYEVIGPLTEITSGKPVEWSAVGQFFKATCNGKPVLLKIAKSPQFNEMMKHELKILKQLTDTWPADSSDPNTVANILSRFPKVSDSFEIVIGGINRVVTVMKDPDKLVSLQEILNHQGKIDRKHIAWMWRRLLEALMHFEECKLTFGGAIPDHILFNLETHEIHIMDVCHAVKLGEKMTSIVPKWKNLYPFEVINKDPTVPSTDTFIAAKSMLCGIETGFGDASDKILLSYFKAASEKLIKNRTENALTLYNRYDDIIYNRLNWKKEFLPFTLKDQL